MYLIMMWYLMMLNPTIFPHTGVEVGAHYEVMNVQYSPQENKTFGVFNRYDVYDTEGTARQKHLQIRWMDGKVTPEVFMRDGGAPTESHVMRGVAPQPVVQ